MQGLYSHWLTINQLDDLISATHVEFHEVTNEKVQEWFLFLREQKTWINQTLFRDSALHELSRRGNNFIAQNTLNSTISQVLPTLKNIPPTRTELTPRKIYSCPLSSLLSGDKHSSPSHSEDTFRFFNQENTRLLLTSAMEESHVWMWQGLWIPAEPGNPLTLQCILMIAHSRYNSILYLGVKHWKTHIKSMSSTNIRHDKNSRDMLVLFSLRERETKLQRIKGKTAWFYGLGCWKSKRNQIKTKLLNLICMFL